MQNRPPIVVVMGHIDHGKTTLLDYIRKTTVAASESGGITQHIGAYEVNNNGKGMTFLDTPGHEAFGKMRSRGARVADVAILVVAADDGVKPQTKEALETIKNAGIPFVVAINKIDKPAADPEKTKNELAELQVFLEGRGGNVPYAEISAKQGTGVDKLLETVLLLAELENITADPKTFASGVVIESHQDHKRGITSTLLVRNGTLKKGEYVTAGGTPTGVSLAKIKILENFKGEPVDSASPSQPVAVVGFDKLPAVGSEFKTFFSQKEAMEAARQAKPPSPKTPSVFTRGGVENERVATIGLVIKSDVSGSAEAILHEIEKLKNDLPAGEAGRLEIKILRAEAGDVSEDDVKMASSAANPLIIAFKVRTSPPARELAERMKAEIAEFEIIYEVADFLKKKIESILPKETKRAVLGRAKILKIFPAKGNIKGQIVGGKVVEGLLKRGAAFDLLRREKNIGDGKIENLQQGRLNTSEVAAGNEFGALVSAKITIAEGDVLEVLANF